MFDRKIYFDHVRADPFGTLDQSAVTGQSAILFVWEMKPPSGDLRHLAYMLATAFHETAQTMWPIEEYGKGSGHSYGAPDPETGEAYYGRGLVQLTWKENYVRAAQELGLVGTPGDLEWHPMRALDLIIATLVMFRGMAQGWFTGVSLGDYFNESTDDPVNARKIINALDQAEKIAGYHAAFLGALEASYVSEAIIPVPVPEPPPAPTPAPPSPVVVHIKVEVEGAEVVID